MSAALRRRSTLEWKVEVTFVLFLPRASTSAINDVAFTREKKGRVGGRQAVREEWRMGWESDRASRSRVAFDFALAVYI